MEYIKCEKDGELSIITMSRGKANALNPAMIEELLSALHGCAIDDDVRGVVLASDRPKFFSSGFDVGEVFQFDRDEMARFFSRFIDCYESMLRIGQFIEHWFSSEATVRKEALIQSLRR